jgi:transcriptional regulator with XRE-family HTH domain
MDMDPGVLSAMEEAERRVPANVRALKAHYGVSDAALGAAFGTSRQTINGRLTNATRLRAAEIAGFARFFNVPPGVLYLTREEAIRWCLDHREAGPISLRATRV